MKENMQEKPFNFAESGFSLGPVPVPDPEEVYGRLKRCVNSNTGIVKHLYPLTLYPSDPNFFKYSTIVCSANRFSGLAPNSQINGGAGLTPTLAKLAAIGEALERYSSSLYDEKELVRSTFRKLSERIPSQHILQPECLELFSPSQYQQPDFPFVPFHEDLETFWTWTYCMIQNRPVLAPAALVYLPYVFRKKEENFTYNTSTGLAFSYSLESAILGGIYESIERDAIMIMWYNRLMFPLVDLQDVPDDVESYLSSRFRLFKRERIHCVDVTTDIGVPVFFTVITGDGYPHEPPLAVGAACRLNPVECFLKSTMEGFQTYAWARYLKQEKEITRDGMGEFRVSGFDKHVQFYTREENYEKAKFCFSSPKRVKLGGLPDLDTRDVYGNLMKAVELVKKAGFPHLLIKDVTSEDVRTLGGYVARVVIPKTVPLNMGTTRRFLAVRRIYDVPFKIGMRPSPTSPADLNPDPHPFP